MSQLKLANMNKPYILYGLLFALLVATGCKKNTLDDQIQDTTSVPGGNIIDPTVPYSVTKLSKFKINGISCAYDTLLNIYYYPISAVAGASLSNFTVNYDTSVGEVMTFGGTKIANGGVINTTYKMNDNIEIKVVNKFNINATYNLVISGLPILVLSAPNTVGTDFVNASIDLIDPDYQLHAGKQEISSNIQIKLRGATARYLPKKSYAVEMVDQSGEENDVSLLGLRNDDDWILDAMYIDQARMRNRVCTDIWNSFNNVPYITSEPTALNGTRGYMVEVFINHQYWGIYCLTEKLDRKQLQIKKQYGDMYKSDESTNETNFVNVSPFSNTLSTWGGWELTYPDLDDTPSPNWGYLYNVGNFIGNATDDDFISGIKDKVDLNNIADYLIFLNIIQGTDNDAKNLYFSFYDYRTAGAFFYSPWDLDGTMGRSWDGSIVSNKIIGTGTNYLLYRLLKLNPNNFKDIVKARWNALKTNQLSKSTMAARIEGYRKLMVNSNAFAREQYIATNITQDLNTETAYMNTWYSAQFDLVDNYINGL
jgi:hypothetical protein